MRCLYVDLDGTLLGPDASLLTGADGRFSLLGVRALQACARAGAEVVIYSGRKQSSVFEAARLIGSSAYIFELGCGLVLDGELEWLTDGLEPSAERRLDLRPDRGHPAARRCCWSTSPGGWSTTRRGPPAARSRTCSAARSTWTRRLTVLEAAGLGWLRLVDNGVIPEAHAIGLMPELPIVHAYHLIPAGSPRPGRSPATCRPAGTRRRTASRSATRARTWRPPASSARSGWWPTRWSATHA